MHAEIDSNIEKVTAVLTSHMESGENFEGAILIGVYLGSQDEIWIQNSGHRFNLRCADVPTFCKLLKTAAQIAKEQPNAD